MEIKAEGSLCHGAWETLIKGKLLWLFPEIINMDIPSPVFVYCIFLRCGPTPGVLVSVCTHSSTEEPRYLLLDSLEKHVVAVKHERQLPSGTTT